MAYVRQTWFDGESGGTPITAARLNTMEVGIEQGARAASTSQDGQVRLADQATTDLGSSTTQVPTVSTLATYVAARVGTGVGTAISFINGETGPAVTFSFSDLSNVVVPEETLDSLGNVITPGPVDGALTQYDGALGHWAATDSSSDYPLLDARYAPLGTAGTEWTVPSYVLQPGETAPPAEFPGGIVWDPSAHTSGEPAPSDVGFAAWTADPAMLSAGSLMTQSVLCASFIPVKGDWAVTRVAVYVTTGGTGTTLSQLGLYDVNGSRVSRADGGIVDETGASTDFNSAGLKLGVFSTPQIRAPGGDVYVAAWSVGGSAAPTLLRGGLSTTGSSLRVSTSFPVRFGTGAAATTTTAPAALGALTAAPSFWAGIVIA